MINIESYIGASFKTTTQESAIPKTKLTIQEDKTSIHRESKHHASYPNYFIMGKPNDSLQTRA